MRETALSMPADKYWQKICGVEFYKIRYFSQWFLYNFLRIRLPKLSDQRGYWLKRGSVYMEEILNSGYLEREVFFQDMLVDSLRELNFDSFFEAGCGFGWNIGRVKKEFSQVRVGGVDFSLSQLFNSKAYLNRQPIPVLNGDNCRLPLKDDAFDVGFSLGVFMNIHPDKIEPALREMARVCRKYIIHIEYDENYTTPALRKKRAFKTNIVSHDYKGMYEKMGLKIQSFKTYEDFGMAYHQFQAKVASNLDRWEGFEGPEKYIFLVVEINS